MYLLHNYLNYLLLSILRFISFIPSTQYHYNSRCVASYGQPGSCVSLYRCPYEARFYYSSPKPNICFWQGFVPVVCCPLSKAPESETPETISPESRDSDASDEKQTIASFTPLLYNIPRCGTRIKKKNRYRIVGGTEAYHGEFPWSAAVFAKTLDGKLVHECGGTIISDQYVLTAAHCFSSFIAENYVIGVGSSALKKTLKYEIETIISHPAFNHSYYYNDIALIKTQRVIQFTMFVRPVCLPSKSVTLSSGVEVSIAGWGYLNFNGQKSEVLNKAHLNIISRTECNNTYAVHRSRKIPLGITEDFICAGAPDYTRDACEADSGGALLRRIQESNSTSKEVEGRFVQIGVVSFGYKCAHNGYPGVYTDVSHFIPWIKANVDFRESRVPPFG